MAGADLVIVGGGPAGLATAIRARMAGLEVVVLDPATPPIDRACGEGVMPEGVAQLEALGVRFAAHERAMFRGIRYLDGELAAEGEFQGPPGLGIRRPLLHGALAARAEALGADLRWGWAARGLTRRGVATDRGEVVGAWLVGADGRSSQVRRWAGLEGRRPRSGRFAVRRHYRMAPWTDRVEVYWGDACEAYLTPVAPDLVGAVLTWTGRAAGFDALLERFPGLRARIAGAPAASRDAGAGPFGARARRSHRGRVVLVGDAACCLDPITGEGVSVALESAEAVVASLVAGEPGRYRTAQRRIARSAARLNRLALLLARLPRLRAAVISSLAARPDLFDRFLALRRGSAGAAAGAVARLSLRLLAANR